MPEKSYQPQPGNFSVRLEARIKNAALVGAREKLGLTIKAVAEELDFNHNTYGAIERMQYYPSSTIQAKIIDFYRMHGIRLSPEVVFPEQLKSFKPQNKYMVFRAVPLAELTQRDVKLLSVDDTTLEINEEINKEQVAVRIRQVLQTLKPREQEVLTMRYGLDGKGQRTLEDVADAFRVTRERIRQIEKKAFEHLRHPKRARMLRESRKSYVN